MEAKKKELRQKEEKALLTFLKQTREGKYAKIDESSLPYSRLKEQREEAYEDEYYYNLDTIASNKIANKIAIEILITLPMKKETSASQ